MKSQRIPIWAYSPVLLLVAVQTPLIWTWGSFVIEGERYFALAEDAMISMRYARNLAEGQGLVWNPGERVEGYTNPLWVLYMAAVHRVGLEDRLNSLVVMATNVVLNGLCLLVLTRLIAAAGGRAATAMAGGIVYALALYPALYALAGMEHTLQTLSVLLACWSILRDHRADRSSALTFLLIGMPAIVRADGLAFTAVLAAVAVWRHGWRPGTPWLLAIAGTPFAAWLAFRLVYYQDLFPNTYYLKMQIPIELRLQNGVLYITNLIQRQAPTFAVIAACQCFSWLRNRDVLMLLIICAGFFAAVTWEGGTTAGPRLLMPAFPLLIAAMVLSLQQLVDAAEQRAGSGTISRSGLARLRPGALTLSVALLVLGTTPNLGPRWVEHYKGWQRAPNFVEMALAIKANTRPESKVAVTGAGVLPYFVRRPVVDLLGISDPHVARLPVSSSGRLAGHNKMDFDWSLGQLKPDLVIAQTKHDASPAEIQRAARGDHAYHGQLRLNPVFRRMYEPNLLPLSARRRRWPNIYVRTDSPEMKTINDWEYP